MKTTTKLWIGLGALAVLSPIGILLPAHFKAGNAWGEWGSETFTALVGYVPKGLEKLSSIWRAPLPNYAPKGLEKATPGHLSIGYIFSALLGIGLCGAAAFLFGKLLTRKGTTKLSQSKKTPRGSGFIEKTLVAIVSVLKEAIANETVASRGGLLQHLDARFKCMSAGVLLAGVLLAKSIVMLSVLYAATLALVIASSISVVFFLERTLLFVPLFSFFIVVPAVFNLVTPGEPLFTFTLFSHALSITKPGLTAAVIFFLRVLTSVSIAVLLVLTTRQHLLLKALRVFGVPQIFVMTMGMCYRYIFLFLDIIQNVFLAIKSRVGFVGSSREGRRIVTANMAGLWLRSYRLQTQVYEAMLSRGYTGEPQVMEEFRAKPLDVALLTVSALLLIGVICLNLSFH